MSNEHHDDRTSVANTLTSKRNRFSSLIAKWTRWLHIYVSMISFAIVLFFGVTGITLNHPTWFGGTNESIRNGSGNLNPDWVRNIDKAGTSLDSTAVARLEIVEHLRRIDRVRGAVGEFTVESDQVVVTFRAPAYSADIFIDRESCKYELVETTLGTIALLNDLHKGRDSGHGWSWLIDASAILMTVVSLTGLVLIFYVKRHRKTGLVSALVGAVVVIVVYIVFVPR
jgi:uncharacterized protein